MNTIFLRPGEYNTQVAITEIICIINNTEGELGIAVAYFNHKILIKALIERAKRGKLTKIILNTSDLLRPVSPDESELYISKELIELINLTQNINTLEIKSLGLNTYGNYQNMHHKFVVSESKVIFGSMNWTHAGFEKNYEIIHISEDRSLINDFIIEFSSLWSKAHDIHARYGKIRGIICPRCNCSDGVDFESYGPLCTFCGHKFNFN